MDSGQVETLGISIWTDPTWPLDKPEFNGLSGVCPRVTEVAVQGQRTPNRGESLDVEFTHRWRIQQSTRAQASICAKDNLPKDFRDYWQVPFVGVVLRWVNVWDARNSQSGTNCHVLLLTFWAATLSVVRTLTNRELDGHHLPTGALQLKSTFAGKGGSMLDHSFGTQGIITKRRRTDSCFQTALPLPLQMGANMVRGRVWFCPFERTVSKQNSSKTSALPDKIRATSTYASHSTQTTTKGVLRIQFCSVAAVFRNFFVSVKSRSEEIGFDLAGNLGYPALVFVPRLPLKIVARKSCSNPEERVSSVPTSGLN
ncbi:hypothetical protein BKA70DRAFT_1241347 [Coprinopsis sp. MPI-PUGE-AT-0042]|nr:hypothetical protein BKA70DRAFT_1241347 [Coprinopsis sp. MPI-PUGE-AT-0042]